MSSSELSKGPILLRCSALLSQSSRSLCAGWWARLKPRLDAVRREVVMSPGRRRIKRLSQMQSLKESAGPCRGSEERKVLKGRDNEDGEGMVLVRDWSLETVAVRKLIWASLGNMHMFMSWIRHRQRGQHLRGSTLTNDIRRLPSRCRFGDVDL